MTRTSKALQRLGVAGIAVATIGAGVPAFFATAASAATTGPVLVADDCTVPSTGNTTTTQTNSAAAGQPSNATGAGSGCVTQAQINTVKTLTFTFTRNGAPVAGQDIDFTLTEGTPNNSANFPNTQPPSNGSGQGGSTSQANSNGVAGQIATCTTNSSGKCSVNVTDSEAEQVTVNGSARGTAATATEIVNFRTDSVAARRLDESDRQLVAPETSGSTSSTAPKASPGRPLQLTYTVTDAQGCATANPAASCTGLPVANQLITLKVDQSAYFTPNCTPRDVTGAPQRTNNDAVAPTTATAGSASTGPLASADYRGCSFETAPVNDAQTGALTSLGQTLTVRTDYRGQFTVTVAEGRDPGFDNDGNVVVGLTATEQGSTTSLTPQNPSSAGSNPNAAASPLAFTTRTRALNGASVDIAFVDGSAAATSTTQNVPNNQTRTFVVYLRDQFGNLTQSTGTSPNDQATITKDGVGTLYKCTGASGGSTSTSDCTGPATAGQQSPTSQNNGTTTQSYVVTGSYTNRTSQERFQSVANSYPGTNGTPSAGCQILGTNCPTPSAVESGTQTLTAKWIAPITEFTVDTTTNAAPFGRTTGAAPAGTTQYPVSGNFDQSETDNVRTRVVSFNYYTQNPTDITFATTPANTVTPGTVVTVSARVLDQFGNPIQGQPVTFFRTGSSNNCTSTTANGTGNGGAVSTGPDGRAGFSFSCDASQQTVTIVVNDRNGNELKRGTQSVTFANPTPASPPASPSATATVSNSPSPSASTTAPSPSASTTAPSPSATATVSNSPSPSASSVAPSPTSSTNPPVARQRVSLTTSTPDIQPNQQGILTATGTPAFNLTLRCYTRPSNTYFDARPNVSNASGTTTFRITPGANTRCFVKYADKNDADSTSSESVVINVHTTLSLSTVRTATGTYTFQGRNLPRRAGQLITLYRVDKAGKEIRTSNLTTDASGIYRVSRKFTGTGTFKFRVRTSQTLNNAAGVSNTITVTVR